ncbi:MAG: hypothetical protein ACFFD6_01365 [Candidatus Thorarchaeota archaeon]
MGLVVATMCIGNVVVAEANDIVNETKVAYYGTAWEYVTEAGGIPVYSARVVSHNHIVTGGTGGGYPSGFETAPTYEVCSEIARLILNRSRLAGLILQPETGSPSENISISITVSDPYEDLSGLNSTEISKVEIYVYHQENSTLAFTTELEPPATDGFTYTGEFIDLRIGEYYFDIEITDSEDRLEVLDTVDTFSVREDIPTPPPPIDPGIIGIPALGLALVAVVGIILVVAKRGTR